MDKLRKIFGIERKEKQYEVPLMLQAKYSKYNLLAGAILVLGFVACVLIYDGLAVFKAFLFPVFLAAFLVADGTYYVNKIEKEGYDTVEGVCISHKFANVGEKLVDADFSITKRVNAVVIETDNEMMLIPIARANDIPPVGCMIKAYLPKDVFIRKNANGTSIPASIYGYELLLDPSDPEEPSGSESAEDFDDQNLDEQD